MPSWFPIKGAPRDGRLIVAVCEGSHPETGAPYWPAVVQWREGGWAEMGEDPCPEDEWPLSHWMPLPPNPAERPTRKI